MQTLSMEERFSLYPNPASSLLQLDYAGPDITDVVVTITDISGKRFISQTLDYLEMNYQSAIDVASLPAGMYIVSFATKNYSQHTRLLID